VSLWISLCGYPDTWVAKKDRAMTVEYAAVAVGTAAVAVAWIWSITRIWRQMRVMEARFAKIQNEIDKLQMQESRRMLMELRANSKLEAPQIGPETRRVEVVGGEVVELVRTPATTPE